MPKDVQMGRYKKDKESVASAKGKLKLSYASAVLANFNNLFQEFSIKGKDAFKKYSKKYPE
ncbi:hypothetical protein SYNTR_1220 [Candidatus Syntrophocurvum alkaliphilum]|uniref:Uncharacterized protein n=1 Tax=Candidatus Syntrophocurvum alkaliphilum TaxID=2293317 RepID=A0A6I6DHR3_9FIRM|nr:hypothetical protein [Candidatus Syntrophocurvum alkaliphilum]QGT99813.1 hypothetical protein SYNTR_1220 [Candidatus Syntrophocurvum alkaliphilum]